MNNNKNHLRTDDKSNSELRKMYPRNGANIGIENGEKLSSKTNKITKRSKFPR